MKRRKKDIKFSVRSHATNGVISTILGAISIILMLALVIVSYVKKGEAGIYIGSIGLSALITAIVGFILGVKSFKERERYYLFSKIGSVLNAVIVMIWIAIYLIGTWFYY